MKRTPQSALPLEGVNRHPERGVLLPVVAVMALALIVTITVLGLETTRVKNAASNLQRELERICRNVSRSALLPDEAVSVFRAEIAALQKIDPFTTVTTVRLLLPLPLDAEITNVQGLLYDFPNRTINRTAAACQGSSYQPSTVSTTVSFAALGQSCLNSPALAPNTECEFVPSICSQQGSSLVANTKYPSTMWSNLTNAGNTVACEMEANVGTILTLSGPSRPIAAKSVWWIPLRPNAPYITTTTVSVNTPQNRDFAGLSIGIAPELTTWTSQNVSANNAPDTRFEFTNTYPASIQAIDPRRTFLGASSPKRFDFGSPARPFDSTFSVPRLNIPNISELTPSQRDELMTACVNPLVLVRNLILETIVELAARHGQTRNLTEISLINPRHQGGWTDLNRPVVVVPFGHDLTAQNFQHPFVTFHGGGVNAQYGDKFGFVLPWFIGSSGYPQNSALSDEIARYHALVSQQLRMCYHLWDTDLTPRLELPLHSSVLLPQEFDFTPSLQRQENSNAQNWDYPLPWGGATPPIERLLNASELVSSLGSIQFCPATLDGTPGFANCVRTNFESKNDLLPDLAAYLTYQANIAFPSGDYPYPSPGLFPPQDSAGAAITSGQPHSLNPLRINPPPTRSQLPRSVVLVAVHKGLFDASQRSQISSLVTQLNNDGRPVIIVFMPGTAEDSNTVDNYCIALNKGSGCSIDNLNRLVFLSPWNTVYGAVYSGAGSDSAVFRSYWIDLLDNSGGVSDPYVYTIARNIFTEGILRHEPKL